MENVHARIDDDGNTEPGDRVGEIIENHQAEYGRTDDCDILEGSEYADGGESIGIGNQQMEGSRDQSQSAEQ